MRKAVLTLALMLACLAASPAETGKWTAYMAYRDISEIEQAANTMYVLASDNLYSYNENDQSVQTYDKVNALSDCAIAHIAWCEAAKRLVIIYHNENIDMLDKDGIVTNLPDYYNKSMTQDKTINSVNIYGAYAYISTNFGILKVDVGAAVILDTYDLGFKVDYSYINGNTIYAASSTNGLYSAPLSANLLDKNNWTLAGSYVPNNKAIDPDLLAVAQGLNPGGPAYNYFSYLKFAYGNLYSVGGMFDSGLTDLNRPGTIQVLGGGKWQVYQDHLDAITGYPYVDINCIGVDPTDTAHVFAGGRTGLYEFEGGTLKSYYNKDNSILQGAIDRGNELGNDYVLISDMQFGQNSNLWLMNSQARNNNIVEWNGQDGLVSHANEALKDPSTQASFTNMKSMFTDNEGLTWFVNVNAPYPALANYNPSSEVVNVYKPPFFNEDGTQVEMYAMRCATMDMDDNIWVGTDMGPFYVPVSQQTDPAGTMLTQVKVPRNDGTSLADYLLSNVDITSIAIDGANRKWFGTNGNGVYLISADNMTQLLHFTQENSKLLSNNIFSMAINGKTGEVFFATDKGLCSYASDATTPATKMTKETVYAYPNPVQPSYNGLITIVGLTLDADVKITTSAGALVAQGRSNGGTFTWDGTDKSGKRVASGVYMVQTATSDGGGGTVCKIAIVR